MSNKKYFIYFCWNGRKHKVAERMEVNRWTFVYATEIWPYDVLDCDDTHIWFDFGDE